jgi:hypothetical protein
MKSNSLNINTKNGVTYITFPSLELDGVAHCFTTRHGGVSSGIFSTMNMSFTRGDDPEAVTENYKRGAECALYLCKTLGIKRAVLKERSPSCGKGKIYDGSFTNTLKDGDGVAAELLSGDGIEVFGESEIYKF